MNQARGTRGLELVLARGCNKRVSHLDDNQTGTGIRKFRIEDSGKVCKSL